MSVTLAEREQLQREFERLNAQGWAEDKLQRVQVFQASHPGWGFAESWDAVEREQQPVPTAGSNGVSFHQVQVEARALMAADPRLPFGRALELARADEVIRGSTLNPLHPDPLVAQELAKHKKLSDTRQANAAGDHADRLAKIRKLMAANPNLTFDAAFTQICQQEREAKAAPATAGHAVN